MKPPPPRRHGIALVCRKFKPGPSAAGLRRRRATDRAMDREMGRAMDRAQNIIFVFNFDKTPISGLLDGAKGELDGSELSRYYVRAVFSWFFEINLLFTKNKSCISSRFGQYTR
jgi:hypothetical protein